MKREPATDRHFWVAVILAVGIATAVNLITVAVLYDAIFSQGPGLSENATQILTTAFGGIIGVLGSYIGYRAGRDVSERRDELAAALNGAPPTPSPRPVNETTERYEPGSGGS